MIQSTQLRDSLAAPLADTMDPPTRHAATPTARALTTHAAGEQVKGALTARGRFTEKRWLVALERLSRV